MKQRHAFLPLSFLASQIQTASAFWRLACSISQVARIDPILNPGSISGHVHKFAGGINVNENSDYASLETSSCSSCEVQKDKSAYWTPDLYYQHADGTFVEVPNNGMTVYYLGRVNGGNGSTTTPFPEGFKMIAGDSRLRAYNNSDLTWDGTRPVADAVSFRCINAANNIPETHGIDQTDCVNGLRAQLNFPTCWNGKDLYLPNSAHMAFLSSIDNGDCPPTHPVPVPHLFYEVLYAVNDIDQSDGGKFVFSQGDPTGYGFHGDFMNGWDPAVLQNAVDNCLYPDLDGVASNCPILAESDNLNFPRICPQQSSVLDERTNGTVEDPLTSLPGCNPVTPGPATAPQLICPVNGSTPVTTSSITSSTTTSSSTTPYTSAIPSFINSTTATTASATSEGTTNSTGFQSSTSTDTSLLTSSTTSTPGAFFPTSSSTETSTTSTVTIITSTISTSTIVSTSSGSSTTSNSSVSSSTLTSTSDIGSTTSSTLTTTSTSTSDISASTTSDDTNSNGVSNTSVANTSTTDSETTGTPISNFSTSADAVTTGSTTSASMTGPASNGAITTTSTSTVSATSTTTDTSNLATTTIGMSTTATTTTSLITILPPMTTTAPSTTSAFSDPSSNTAGITWTWVVGGRTFYFTWGGSFAKRSEPTNPPAPVSGGETTTTLRIKGREFVHVS